MIVKLVKDQYEYRRFLILVRKDDSTPPAEYIASQLSKITKMPFFVESDVSNMARIATRNIGNRRLRKKWMNKEIEIV